MGKTELLITIIAFNIFFVLFVLAVMVYIRKYMLRKKEYLNEIEVKTEIHKRELLATQLEIQQATMQQIGQKLTLVSLYTQQLLYENKVPEVSERKQEWVLQFSPSKTDLLKLKSISNKSNLTIIVFLQKR